MARTIVQSDTANAIRRGTLDKELAEIEYAVASRKKQMFRPGTKVRLVNLRPASPRLEGQIGTVIKVNAKRVSVGIGTKQPWGGYDGGEPLVPIEMLELV